MYKYIYIYVCVYVLYIYICMHACVTLPVVFHVSLDVGLGQGDGTLGEAMERHRANQCIRCALVLGFDRSGLRLGCSQNGI